MMHYRSVGLDVHRATISVAIADPDQPPVSYGKIPNEPKAIHKLMQRLGGPERILQVAYETRPTGYVVHRQLTELGISATHTERATRTAQGDRSGRPRTAWLRLGSRRAAGGGAHGQPHERVA